MPMQETMREMMGGTMNPPWPMGRGEWLELTLFQIGAVASSPCLWFLYAGHRYPQTGGDAATRLA